MALKPLSSTNKLLRHFSKTASSVIKIQTQANAKFHLLNEEFENNKQQNFNKNNPSKKSITTLGALIGLGSFAYWKLKNESQNFPKLRTINAARPFDPPPDNNGGDSRRFQFNFIADVVRMTGPAVVSIEQRIKVPFTRGRQMPISNGSGFIVDSKGLIITNAHVVQNKSVVTVRLQDGRQYEGRVLAVDESLDLAAVQINCHDLHALKLGASSEVQTGEWVIAMGSPLALDNTVTAGIVSNMNRAGRQLGLDREKQSMNYIQTDATITMGNSGGPLVNLDGEVIGVNTMMASVGIAFAIPSDYVVDFLKRLREYQSSPANKQTAKPRRRYIGITMLTLSPDVSMQLRGMNPDFPNISQGVYVHKVAPNSPAENAGMQDGDVIISANSQPVTRTQDVYAALNEYTTVTFEILRRNRTIRLRVSPEEVI